MMSRIAFFAAAFFVIASPLVAQLPETKFDSVYPAGGGRGTTFDVRVFGAEDLEYATTPRLIFDHPGIAAVPVVEPVDGTWVPGAFRVTIASDVPPGSYDIRLSGRYGTSPPRSFRVDAAKSQVEVADLTDETPAALAANVAFYGRIGTTADVDRFEFHGEAGTSVVVSCEAGDLDSPLQPLIEVSAPTGRRIAGAGEAFGSRAVVPISLTETGEYEIRLTDAAYHGSDSFHYRIEIATSPIVTAVWPPFGQPGTSQKCEFIGFQLHGGVPAGDDAGLMRKPVEIELPADNSTLPTSRRIASNQADVDGFDLLTQPFGIDAAPRPFFFAPTRPVLEDVATGENPQAVSFPTEIAGRFEKTFDTDRYEFDLKAGESVVGDVYAKRYGSAADPVIAIDKLESADGKATRRIAVVDDQPENLAPGVFDTATDDPAIRFDAPDDGRYRVTVRDRYPAARGDDSLFYRLSLRRPAPDFRLYVVPHTRNEKTQTVAPASLNLRRGQNIAVPILLDRRDGFDGPVRVDAEGLPAGLTTTGTTIGQGQRSATLVLTAATGAEVWQGPIVLFGEAVLPGDTKPTRRSVRAGTVIRGAANDSSESRMAHTLFVSVLEDTVPFRLDGDGQPVRVAQGSQVLVPLTATRHDGYDAAIAVSADPLSSDLKLRVETGTLTIEKPRLLARLIIDPEAPPRSGTIQFHGRAPFKAALFPHRLSRASAAHEHASQAFAAAQKALAKSTALRDETAAALAEADKVVSSADEASQAEAKAEAALLRATLVEREAAVTADRPLFEQSESDKKAADAGLAEARKAAEPRSIELSSPAPAVVVTIVPAPVTLVAVPDRDGKLSRNETVAVQVVAARRDGFAGPVRLSLFVPEDVKGLSAEPVVIESGQTEAALQITAKDEAVDGVVPFAALRAVAAGDETPPIDVPIALEVSPEP